MCNCIYQTTKNRDMFVFFVPVIVCPPPVSFSVNQVCFSASGSLTSRNLLDCLHHSFSFVLLS